MKRLPKILIIFLFQFYVLLSFSFVYAQGDVMDGGQVSPDEQAQTNSSVGMPVLQIPIPNVHFSPSIKCTTSGDENKNCVNWIAEYIAGIYKYAIGIVGILATVVMMIGGVMWMMSGGNASTAGEAKSWITSSLTGLIIALSSYLILYQVNPALVVWGSFKLPVVQALQINEEILNYTGFTADSGVSGTGYNDTKWDALIIQTANNIGVNPVLLKAIMAAESAGRENAVSAKGAIGLVQLMPKTAAWLHVTNPYDPAQNLAGGAVFIKSLLNNYNQDVNMALAAYNWGPGNLKKNGYNNMPAETRDYVNRVTTYYGKFSGTLR